MRKKFLTSIVALTMLATLLTGCSNTSKTASSDDSPLVIGSKDFTESIIIAEVYALALEDNGVKVERKLQLGSSVIHDAIVNDEIDFYPEYTGTGLITRLEEDPIYDPEECYEKVKASYTEKFDITWLAHSNVNDSEGIAMLSSDAEKFGIKTFSDLWAQSSNIVFGANGEFYEQAGVFDRLQEVYGEVSFKDAVTMDHTLSFQAAKSGDVNAISVYTTEGSLAGGDFVILEDDKACWPPYYLAPIIRNDALNAHPEVAEIVDKVTATFTDENVIAMNAKVDNDGEEYSDVAKEYYESIKDSLN
jgi:osmoprotectant transport system substrate-binding protein